MTNAPSTTGEMDVAAIRDHYGAELHICASRGSEAPFARDTNADFQWLVSEVARLIAQHRQLSDSIEPQARLIQTQADQIGDLEAQLAERDREIERLRAALEHKANANCHADNGTHHSGCPGWERMRDEEVERLRAALEQIQHWDCLNPPDPKLCADHPWLRSVVDKALGSDKRALGRVDDRR